MSTDAPAIRLEYMQVSHALMPYCIVVRRTCNHHLFSWLDTSLLLCSACIFATVNNYDTVW